MATATRTEMAETYLALKVVNLGWEIRQPGDFIPEYTEENRDAEGISEKAVNRLVSLRYIERRLVPLAELEAFEEMHQRPQEEVPEAEEGESSEETPNPVETESETTETPAPVEEEIIEDLGPVEIPDEESQPKKKVVRRRGGN